MISEAQARKYCKEDISLIENYEQAINDNTQKWHCHHRRESVYTRKGLIEIGEYYHRPAIELIFLTDSEHRKLHSIGNNWLGKHHSEDAKKKMSESRMGKHHSEDAKKKMSESHMGKHLSDETKKKISKSLSKPIIQYTKDWEFIKEWTSGIEASKVLGIHMGNITSCCKGKLKSAGGFVWKYAEVELPNIPFINT